MITRNTLYSVVLCALFSQVLCLGADYYVDATGGNDANAGTTTATAWKSVAKVNGRTFSPGDRILFKRGETWREQLVIPSSGVAGNPITFGAYGTGNRPTLKGSTLPGGWTNAGGSLWRASLSSTPSQVFFSGTRGTKVSGTSSVNSANKWYWSGGVLYVYAASNPASTVEASVRPSTRSYGLLHLTGRQYVNIESFNVTQSSSFGLYLKPAASYITVRDCEVSHAIDGGLVAPSSSGTGCSQITVEDCLVHHNNTGYIGGGVPGTDTYHEGLTMERVNGFVIRRTKVYDNYMEGSNFKRGAINGLIEYCDLYSNDLINQYIEGASNIEIRYNRIYDCSYNSGIEFGMETDTYHNDNVRIHHNLFWNNSGGVSFWAGSFTGQHRNIKIENNTFYNNWEAIRWKSGATDNYSGTNYIRNNLFWQSSASNRAIWDYTSSSQAISRTTIAYNAFQQGAASATTGSSAKMMSDPYFVNATSRDFHLQSSSPCINVGTSIGWTADIDGTTIPQGGTPDIGADEYGSGTTPTPASYTLTVSAANGTVTRTPNQTSYTAGATVTLQATPNSGYTFSGWSGSLSGSANPATITIDSDESVTAGFLADTSASYTLTIDATDGTVTATPDRASYTAGETVTLQANPNAGYTFAGWTGALTGSANPTTLVMNSDKSVTAGFTADAYILTVDAANGTVTRTPNQTSYTYGDIVTLEAVADTGYSFAGWSGDASGTGDVVAVTMNADRTVTANFTSVDSDGQAPVLANCLPAPDSIQAPRNTLVILHLCDEGRGVDAASVAIRVNGDVIYTGNVDSYFSAHGVCHRSGTGADYTYTYQRSKPFRYSEQVSVAVNARDLAGNLMSQQTYSFATEMHSFARSQMVSESQVNLLQGKSAAAGDGEENVWVAWHAGDAGHRHVYAARMSCADGTFGDAMQVSQGAGDHANPVVALDDAGIVYVAWQENARGAWEVCLSTSANGQPWSTPKRIAGATDAGSNTVDDQVNPAIAAGGVVAVAWQDGRAGNQDICVAVSSDRFATTAVSRVTTNVADQTDPVVAVDSEDEIVVLWTDARNGSTDVYGAASDDGLWMNRPVVNSGGSQSQPAIAAGSSGRMLHMVWTDDADGDPDICYAASQGLPGSPIVGSCIIDDTSNADQQEAVVEAVAQEDGVDAVFACWRDDRNVAYGGDTDVYFADLSEGSSRTNVLIDGGRRGDQSDPAIAAGGECPWIAWTDETSGKSAVHCSGATHADSSPLVEEELAPALDVVVGTAPSNVAGLDDVSVRIPAGACSLGVTVSISPIRNPQGDAMQAWGGYEFGPSGLTFARPVTITIPYAAQGAAGVRACWFDCATGTFSEQGITDVQSVRVGSGLYAMQFKTTHFTPYYIVSADAASTSGGSGGGCSLTGGEEGSVIEYFVPYLFLASAMIVLRCRDKRRRSVLSNRDWTIGSRP